MDGATLADTNEQLETYEEFDFGVSYYSSPFWNIIRKVERALSIEPYAIAWSNLNRFDVRYADHQIIPS